MFLWKIAFSLTVSCGNKFQLFLNKTVYLYIYIFDFYFMFIFEEVLNFILFKILTILICIFDIFITF